MRSRVIFCCIVALLISLFSVNLAAQVIPKSIQEGGSEAVLRARQNAGTVGIAGGLLSGTYMRFVDEMASVLDDGDSLRDSDRDSDNDFAEQESGKHRLRAGLRAALRS